MIKPITLGIVGTRHDVDADYVFAVIDEAIAMVERALGGKVTRIVSGGNPNKRGVDQIAKRAAGCYPNMSFTEFPERGEPYPSFQQRCHARNQKIADISDALLALPCEHSKGTYDTITRFIRKQGDDMRVLLVQHVKCGV